MGKHDSVIESQKGYQNNELATSVHHFENKIDLVMRKTLLDRMIDGASKGFATFMFSSIAFTTLYLTGGYIYRYTVLTPEERLENYNLTKKLDDPNSLSSLIMATSNEKVVLEKKPKPAVENVAE